MPDLSWLRDYMPDETQRQLWRQNVEDWRASLRETADRWGVHNLTSDAWERMKNISLPEKVIIFLHEKKQSVGFLSVTFLS